MKKKLFILAIMIIAVMSIFVISASALEQSLFNGTVIDLDDDEDLDTARTVFDNGDGTTSIYYTSQIGYVENDSYKTFKLDLSKITDKQYGVEDIIAIEIFEGPKCILKSISTTWTNLQYIKTSSTIDNIEEQAFLGLQKLEVVDMSDSTSATTLKAELFKNCSNLKKVILPPNITSLGQWMFPNCTNLSEIYMPATITTISRNLHLSTTKSNFVIYFTGPYSEDASSAIQILIAYSNVDASKITCVSATDFNPNATPATQCTIVYDYSVCDAFYNGNHDYKGTGSCIDGVSCEICNKTIAGTSGHNDAETLVFANGITAEGVHCIGCQNDGCTVKTETKVAPVFTAKGYSTNADKNAINGGYSVDLDSLALYERIVGKLNYGIIIANANSFGGNTFLDANNKVNSTKALQVEMDKQYSNFDCSINFGTNTDMELDLVICAYVIEGDTVTYIQSSTGEDVTIGGTAFKSVTLAQVVALVPAEIKEN